ncbi:bifunctional 3-(3-hydroxy-phenyl)propionate/3-hydroxycinnamic acid hydroxylase [Halioxenophilus aromaticivorans]|uniref:Bifunctional 3-(3-hydroxy-phenyl)propionate/3-hydroxycinnamic acid hydroxylase n=1 Tax=Halioxenophilus aromaticivorans TaxID=1306992 RepID=A0AAV3U2X1_9ALTE
MYDVAIIGCGPVGALAANLCGKAGLNTLVIEKEANPYPLPRAVHLDHEMMRFFQAADLIDDVVGDMRDTEGHLHVGADLGVIRYMGTKGQARPFGWSNDYFFYQPELEDHLRDALAKYDNVELKLGTEFTLLKQAEGQPVALTISHQGQAQTVDAQWVIACDGARSSVRKFLNIELDDLKFDEPWLVVDAEVDGPVRFPDIWGMPEDADIQQLSVMMCDPKRPATVVPGRGNHRRWEFMLLPDEDPQAMMQPENVAPLMEPWLGAIPHKIVRAATYRFHALIAEQWQQGQVFLAGDAAHQTPPFFGQGMCHGLRDVSNLVWKMELIFKGLAPRSILQTYQEERDPHVRAVISTAVDAGRYICVLDENKAAARDADIREKAASGQLAKTGAGIIPPLKAGVVATHTSGAGERFIQPSLQTDSGEQLMDNILGCGWRLFAANASLAAQAQQTLAQWPAQFNVRVVDCQTLADAGAIAAWLEQHNAKTVVVRPDAYVFGTANSAAELLSQLAQSLSLEIEPCH